MVVFSFESGQFLMFYWLSLFCAIRVLPYVDGIGYLSFGIFDCNKRYYKHCKPSGIFFSSLVTTHNTKKQMFWLTREEDQMIQSISHLGLSSIPHLAFIICTRNIHATNPFRNVFQILCKFWSDYIHVKRKAFSASSCFDRICRESDFSLNERIAYSDETFGRYHVWLPAGSYTFVIQVPDRPAFVTHVDIPVQGGVARDFLLP